MVMKNSQPRWVAEIRFNLSWMSSFPKLLQFWTFSMALTRKLQHSYSEKQTKSKPSFREVPFSVSLEGNLAEGKIDLLFEEGGRWLTMDYKTMMFQGRSWISLSTPTSSPRKAS